MKTFKIVLITLLFVAPAILFAQSKVKADSVPNKGEYQKRTYRKRMKLTSQDSIRVKENAPILNDNGTSSTTGTIDGRSATGRPGADTTVGYTVKRRKVTTTVIDGGQPASVKGKKKKP